MIVALSVLLFSFPFRFFDVFSPVTAPNCEFQKNDYFLNLYTLAMWYYPVLVIYIKLL